MSEEAIDPAAPLPLFVLSFRQRDELADIAARGGWQVIAARRAAGAERRFVTSGAPIAVVDARGAVADGLAAAQALGPTIETRGGALLALVSSGDIGTVASFHAAGATHFLASPFSEAELVLALSFALRHTQRMAGEWRASAPAGPLGWRIEARGGPVLLTAELARALDSDAVTSPRTLLAQLEPTDRRSVIGAVRRLAGGTGTTASAHDIAGLGRVVQHLQRDPASGRIDALIEPLGSAPEPAAVLRDAAVGARDAAGARRWIERRLAEPDGAPLTVMIVALNRFDIVNAAYGRAAGDRLLRAAFRRIEEGVATTLGAGALVTRLSGPEFLVAVQQEGAAIDQVAGRIAADLARPFVGGARSAVLGCRIGIATRATDDTAALLLRRAGEALSDARDSDTATVRVADAADASLDLLAVELGPAIERGEIDIRYQPQVSIATRDIIGVEALARWQHPAGVIGADLLFAVAAHADLEIALSDHIQRSVLKQAGDWPPSLQSMRLSLNLTAGDIARPGFVDLLLDRIDASGFARDRLTIEITESGLIEELGSAATLLATLRQAGCRIAIDDFGTGYSSLAYLKALPLDYLKIDKKLTQDITGSPRDRVVVRGVIDMARSLGLTVIAEGVETVEQRDLLAAEGCQIYQGFLCAGAVDVGALETLLRR